MASRGSPRLDLMPELVLLQRFDYVRIASPEAGRLPRNIFGIE